MTKWLWQNDYDKMTKWLWQNDYNKMSIWQNEHLTKWPFDKMTIWQKDHFTKGPCDKMTIWQNDHLTKWPFHKMTISQIDHFTKWPFHKMTISQNDNLTETQLIRWQFVNMIIKKNTFNSLASITKKYLKHWQLVEHFFDHHLSEKKIFLKSFAGSTKAC